MTQKRALEIMQNIIVEKTTYLNTLKYEEQRMKKTELHTDSVKIELAKTREEITAMIIGKGALQTYRDFHNMEGKKNEL